jgi:hypothetical protein
MSNILETLEKLNSFTELPRGWNFGSGEPIARNVKINCSNVILVTYGLGLNDTDVFPGTEGDVQLDVYKGDATLELIFNTDGTVSVSFDENDTHVCLSRAASIGEVYKYLKEFQNDQCRLSAYLTSHATMSPESGDLRASRSRHRATEVGSQSSIGSVPRSIVEQSALTSRSTTQARQALQSSFGRYRPTRFQTDAHMCRA